MCRRGGYTKDFSTRFGNIKVLEKPEGERVWLHAVSVGEVRAIEPLVRGLLERGMEVVVSTNSSTGYRIARDMYLNDAELVTYFPVDFLPFSVRAWNCIQPTLVIQMEGELWPEHLYQAQQRGVPAVIINGRMSDNSFRKFGHAKFLLKHLIFNRLSKVIAATEQDYERYIALGSPKAITEVTGNIKFDVTPERVLDEGERVVLIREFGFVKGDEERPLILLGSSTWPGEEALLIEAYNEAIDAGIDCRLLLVPRHAERYPELSQLLRKQPLSYHFRSLGERAPEGTRIYVADTTGELSVLSQVADLAFVGKSLPPHDGGQTPIELAALGIPMVYGPNMSNFRQICRSLESMEASVVAQGANSVKAELLRLMKDGHARNQLSKNARQWHQKNQGATKRTINLLGTILSS